jgi:erythromycin esterase-like protein
VPSTGLWCFWSESAQIAPLFAYARESWKTESPLRMAGFDLQFTGGEPELARRFRVHAAHTRLSPQFDSLASTDTVVSLESTGRITKVKLGDAMYSVGMIAYEGHWGFPGDAVMPIRKAVAGELETLLNEMGQPFAILDLRSARVPGHWLLEPMPGSLSAQVQVPPYPVVWPDVFDGVLFVQRMTPHTQKR